jgi:hypothetical protein
MNKKEIAETLRLEVGHLELEIKKLHARCERFKQFVLDLEDDIAGPEAKNQKPEPPTKFQKVIDQVFGEAPKSRKR